MKLKRYLAAAVALTVAVTCTGCELGDTIMKKLLGIEDHTLTEEQQAARFDIDGLKQKAEALSDTWTRPEKEAELREELDAMVADLDAVAEVYFTHEMAYYADWENPSKDAMYGQTYEDYYVAFEIFYWVLCNGYSKSAYDELFAEYLGADAENKDLLNYYTTTSLDLVIRYGQSDSSYYSGALDDYYEISGDTSMDEEDADLQCAEMYLDNLKTYDCGNYLYDYFARDYEAADASALYERMLTELQPLYDELYTLIAEHPYYEDLYTDAFGVSDMLGTVQKFTGEISPELERSAKKLIDEEWYMIGQGDACYTGSYCISIPGQEKALLYIYQSEQYYDLYTAVHEFGHFHAEWRDDTPLFFQENCVDIAEVHSQGLSMLYTAFYDEIFGEAAEYLELVTLYDLVDSIVCGLAVGEFEYRVMQQLDDITPEEVVELFYEINEACNTGYVLKDISHLYEQPGYYISYAVSAIPAMEIYQTMQDDFGAAVAKYEAIADISSNDGKYRIRGALEECGFADIFSHDTMESIADEVRSAIDGFEQ
ncbi:MAG: hypothetical protein IJC75_02370 [Oscillospiraceae bacterium]|nr:hypothetical protein [Oscillospiraceae bacterium]